MALALPRTARHSPGHETAAPRHSFAADAQGIAQGSFMAAVSVVLLTHLGFATGQTAGLAILISYAAGWSFGPVFFAVNMPFYWLGRKRFGSAFVAKSFMAVAILSALTLIPTLILPPHLRFGTVHPAIGCLTGACSIALFRHGSSLGGHRDRGALHPGCHGRPGRVGATGL